MQILKNTAQVMLPTCFGGFCVKSKMAASLKSNANGNCKDSTNSGTEVQIYNDNKNQFLHEVIVERDIVYFAGNETLKTHKKHKLNLFYPKQCAHASESSTNISSNNNSNTGSTSTSNSSNPGRSCNGGPDCCCHDGKVVIFVHGGGWAGGDRNFAWGRYDSLGMCLASRGFTTAIISYRLSPFVKHPEHVRDVIRAIKWTQNNVHKYGGNPHKLFLCGESAGGHLVSLATLHPTYLKEEGVDLRSIKGVIGLSGVYDLERLFQRPLGKMWFWPAFGWTGQTWKEASPLTYIPASITGNNNSTDENSGSENNSVDVPDHITDVKDEKTASIFPPFLLFNAQWDFHLHDDTTKLQALLELHKVPVKSLCIPQHNHFTIAGLFTHYGNNVVTKEVTQFLLENGN